MEQTEPSRGAYKKDIEPLYGGEEDRWLRPALRNCPARPTYSTWHSYILENPRGSTRPLKTRNQYVRPIENSPQDPQDELRVPNCTHRSFWGSGKPSRAQEMVGVGVPEAMHLRDTLGPGVSVWLMNLYSSSGGEAVRGGRERW